MLCGLEGEKRSAPAKVVVAAMCVVAVEREERVRLGGYLGGRKGKHLGVSSY